MLARACRPRPSLPASPRTQCHSIVLAAASKQAGSGGFPDETRSLGLFQTPYRTHRRENCTQEVLEDLLKDEEAEGFATSAGVYSRKLADLPEGANVRLLYKEDILAILSKVRPCFVCSPVPHPETGLSGWHP